MARITIEDSLKYIKNADRFILVHEAVKLAKHCPIDADHKPAVWALKAIAEGQHNHTQEESVTL